MIFAEKASYVTPQIYKRSVDQDQVDAGRHYHSGKITQCDKTSDQREHAHRQYLCLLTKTQSIEKIEGVVTSRLQNHGKPTIKINGEFDDAFCCADSLFVGKHGI